MADLLLMLPILISLLLSFFLMPVWIRKSKEIDLVWDDVHKKDETKVAGSGGLIVVLAFVIGVLIFVTYRVFVLDTDKFLIEILATLTVILFLFVVGFIDDLLGWRKGGLRRRHRLVLAALASIPLIAINAGKSVVSIPFLGLIDLGLIYPLLIIPIGIVGAATTFNFLAGFNGLEASQGIILLISIALVAFYTGSPWLSIISLCMVASLIGFLHYNKFPAKIFPGDTLTYCVGGLVAIIAILGNFEKIAVFFFIPYIFETILKSKGKLVKESFGKLNEDGSLGLRYDKIYSLNHLWIFFMIKLGIKPTERRVVYFNNIFQIIVILIGFYIFRKGIFL